jgi:ferritin-like metal-binding protein YciE
MNEKFGSFTSQAVPECVSTNTSSSREKHPLFYELMTTQHLLVKKGNMKGQHMFGKVKSLRELFEIELGYAYDCEKKLVEKGLPSMIENASANQLRSALEQHLQETRSHVSRLERVFSSLGVEPKTESNAILDELTSAAKDSVSHTEDSALRDTALVVNGTFVEHYEIALYSALVLLAKKLGLQAAAALLAETLSEEKAADAKLIQIAESSLNLQSARQTA